MNNRARLFKYIGYVGTGVLLLFIVKLAFFCLHHAQEWGSEKVTMVSGYWSAGATAVLGWLAYWQNKRYKELADQANDLAFMPDFFEYQGTNLVNALSEGNLCIEVFPDDNINFSQNSSLSYVHAEIQCINLDRPIRSIEPKKLIINKVIYKKFHSSKNVSIYERNKQFVISLVLPNDGKREYEIELSLLVTGLYGTQYIKNIFLQVDRDRDRDKKITNIRMTMPERVK